MTDNNQHPITPPPELLLQWNQEWRQEPLTLDTPPTTYDEWIGTKSAQWGYEQRGAVNEAKVQKARDEELGECVAWLSSNQNPLWALALKEGRRPNPPNPPSLKEQALRHVGVIQDNWTMLGDGESASPSLTGQITYEQLQDILRALEQLPNG